ncbi:hypothetical protein RI367_005681 [Sorochytrium milnesiophthora]
MGVQGLTSYVARRPQLGTETVLSPGTKLVIDVMAWIHQLYFDHVEWLLSGNTRQFQDLLKAQLTELSTNRVATVVCYVYDGARNHGGKLNVKFHRDEARVEGCMDAARQLSNNGPFELVAGKLHPRRQFGDPVLPSSTFDTALQLMKAMNLPVQVAADEADGLIASIARRKGAIVISRDSDFFIFDVPAGYISIDTWTWYTDWSGGFHMQGTLHRQSRIARHLGLSPVLMPLLATLLGNDNVPRDNALARYIYNQADGRLTADERIEHLAKFLAKYNRVINPNKAIESIAQLAGFATVNGSSTSALRTNPKSDLVCDVQASVALYREVDKTDTFLDMPGNAFAARINQLFVSGTLSVRLIDVYYHRVFEAYTLIEDTSKSTAWDLSLPLRIPLYALWLHLRQRAGVGDDKEEGCLNSVQENSRREARPVPVTVTVDPTTMLHLSGRASTDSASGESEVRYGLCTLHRIFLRLHHAETAKLDHFEPYVQALVIYVCFCVGRSAEQPRKAKLCCRTLVALVLACLFPFDTPPSLPGFQPTLKALHTVAQWQATLISSSLLAQTMFTLLLHLNMAHQEGAEALSATQTELHKMCMGANATYYDGPLFAFYYTHLTEGGYTQLEQIFSHEQPEMDALKREVFIKRRFKTVCQVLDAIGCPELKIRT